MLLPKFDQNCGNGVGAEMFVDNELLWSWLRQESIEQLAEEKYIASMARTDPGQLSNVTYGESQHLPIRSKEERPTYLNQFTTDLQRQLARHGDRRLSGQYGHIAFDLRNKAYDVSNQLMNLEAIRLSIYLNRMAYLSIS